MHVASMPMYDMPEVRPALDTLWTGLARHLEGEGIPDVPRSLVHDRGLAELWNDPDLLFSQCCGFDLVNGYAGRLQPIAVPHYDVPGCRGSDYASMVVVAEDSTAGDVLQMRGAVCVINGPESHSGMGALRALVAPESREGRFFAEVKVSGTHAASLEMVRRGAAELAGAGHRRRAKARQQRVGDAIDGRHVGLAAPQHLQAGGVGAARLDLGEEAALPAFRRDQGPERPHARVGLGAVNDAHRATHLQHVGGG